MKLWLFIIVAIFVVGCKTKIQDQLPLREFEGLYEYEDDQTLVIVAGANRDTQNDQHLRSEQAYQSNPSLMGKITLN